MTTATSRLCVRENILDTGTIDSLQRLAVRERAAFDPGTTRRGTTGIRRALVLDPVVFDSRSQVLAEAVTSALINEISEAAPTLGVDPATLTDLELLVVATVDGGGYPTHVDRAQTGQAAHRRLSAVVFWHREPRAFTGGDLIVRDTARPVTIEPRPGRLVVFSSDLPHEVTTVGVPSGAFADSRFTLAAFVS